MARTEKLRFFCIKYGESVLPESMVFPDGRNAISVPITFCVYCIRTKDRNILVDAGCDTMPGFVMTDFRSPANALQDIGLTAEEITDVVISHSHHDHIDAVRHFRNAVVHITKAAYEKGKKYIPEAASVALFEKEHWLTQQIRILEWGGHAKGSSVVEITVGDEIHVLAGDECYTMENIRQKRPTGSFVEKTRAEEFVEVYGRAPYCVHTCHDAALKTEKII